MKRKNILKFVGLLGIGSFVMLAAASCTQTITRTPNQNPSSNSGSITDGMPTTNNNQSSGANMNSADPELTAARMALSTLHDSKDKNTQLYVDYAKIKDNLTKAYDAAKSVLDSSESTTQSVNEAKTKLDEAISTAASSKQSFDEQNATLVEEYKKLKETLARESSALSPFAEAKFAGIKMHLSGLYSAAKSIVSKTLDPVDGSMLTSKDLMDANINITNAFKDETLNPQKDNATKFAEGFVKQVLVKDKITEATTNMMPQPRNYSFVGYSVDVTGANGQQNTVPNWNFAQRKIFELSNNNIVNNTGASGMEEPLSNVSWIYSLPGSAKYTLEFDYYGPSTGYLYFPYKSIKTSDSVGLQYKLNDATTPTQITFGDQATMNGKMPTVSDINVAKLTLSNLKFGQNKIEFSVPSDKVNPMIGNMYLTSSTNNSDKIINDIFGNSITTTEDKKIKVSVDHLKGYSLAADWSVIIREYGASDLTLDDVSTNGKKYHLINFVGGTDPRKIESIESMQDANVHKLPTSTNTRTSRTYTLYVNAPVAGDYYIGGVYISGTQNSVGTNLWLQFSTNGDDNVVEFETPGNGTNSTDGNWSTKLKTFDTSKELSTPVHNEMKKTLKLKAGLNKVNVTGVDGKGGGYASNFGYLTFTLMNQAM